MNRNDVEVDNNTNYLSMLQIVVLLMIVGEIGNLFDTVRTTFGF